VNKKLPGAASKKLSEIAAAKGHDKKVKARSRPSLTLGVFVLFAALWRTAV
jgi:hypothetical protein